MQSESLQSQLVRKRKFTMNLYITKFPFSLEEDSLHTPFKNATAVSLFCLEQGLILVHLHIHAFVKIQSHIKVQTQSQNSKQSLCLVKQMHIARGEGDKAAFCIYLID